MPYPIFLRRLGAAPGLIRLAALISECLALISLSLHGLPGKHDYSTSYVILGYLLLVDAVEIGCLCGQPRGWPLAALPKLMAADTFGALLLLCSRDWYGMWYWEQRGPWYSLSRAIGTRLFVALPLFRIALVVLAVCEYRYENQGRRYDRVILPREREALLPR